MHRQLSLCGIAIVFVTAACSSNDNGGSSPCPPCAAGTVCSPATGQCLPEAACTPGTSCGANAVCSAQGVCGCVLGWTDCNADLAGGGDGCECDKACNGSSCGVETACQPTVASSCGGDSAYCDGTTCQACPAGMFNCDGLADCESSAPCQVAPGCQPDVANSCGSTAEYCEAGSCTACPAGTSNCDGTGPCECSQGCDGAACASEPPPPSPCDPSCTKLFEFLCVKSASGTCQACDNSDDHCRDNPRANGPLCVNTRCVCNTDADCSGRTTGPFCRQSGGVKKCACDSPADCHAPYTLCLGLDTAGQLAKQCQKACATDADCVKGGATGTCDTATGLCKF